VINRYKLAVWMPMKYNFDGSQNIYIQSPSPDANQEANWQLASASGLFNLTVRNYWPTAAVLDGSNNPQLSVRRSKFKRQEYFTEHERTQ